MDYVLALDQGTTSSRAILYDRQCRVVGVAQREFAQIYPRPGEVEHDAQAIWDTQRECAAKVLADARVKDGEVAAVGVTNQRETVVVWERATGRPIRNAIVWQDRRTAAACEALRTAGKAELVARKTGLVVDPYFTATKLKWILDATDGARTAAQRGELCAGTIDSWILFQLTKGAAHVTDASNASRTMLFDIHRGDWDDELLELFSVPRAMLPEVRDSSGRVAAVAAGLPASGAPIAGIAGDQQAALFGQMCWEPGLAKNTYGTGCFLLLHTGARPVASANRLLSTVAWRIGGKLEYALEGAVFTGGAVVQWLRDELRLVASARECDELAQSVPDTGGVFLVPAFAGLGAPHWDPHARGALLGMTRGSTRAHVCRAALQGVALQVADLVACMEKDSGLGLRELRVDGGACRSDVMMQMQADLLGVPVVRPLDVESTARGAAMLAGLGVGFYDRKALASAQQSGSRIAPGARREDLVAVRAGWKRSVAAAQAFGSGS
jgi:glycerol kinase